jgi:hypothetical protein
LGEGSKRGVSIEEKAEPCKGVRRGIIPLALN